MLRHGVLCAAGVPGRRDRHRLRPSAAGLGSGSGSAVWGAERRRPPAHPILEPSGLPAQWPGRVGRAADAAPSGAGAVHHRGAAAGPGGLAAAEAGERLSGGDRRAAADGGEHRAAAGRRGAGAYPLPAGIPGLPGRGDVFRGRELLHLLLRAGSGVGGSVRGAGVPETGHRPAADPQRSGTVP